MRSGDKKERRAIMLGVYALLAMGAAVGILYIIAENMKEPPNNVVACYAVQNIFNDLEDAYKKYQTTGYPSTVSKEHNKRLDNALKAAKSGGCFTQNLPVIDRYLRLDD